MGNGAQVDVLQVAAHGHPARQPRDREPAGTQGLAQRVRHELQEIGQPTLEDILKKKFRKK